MSKYDDEEDEGKRQKFPFYRIAILGASEVRSRNRKKTSKVGKTSIVSQFVNHSIPPDDKTVVHERTEDLRQTKFSSKNRDQQ